MNPYSWRSREIYCSNANPDGPSLMSASRRSYLQARISLCCLSDVLMMCSSSLVLMLSCVFAFTSSMIFLMSSGEAPARARPAEIFSGWNGSVVPFFLMMYISLIR